MIGIHLTARARENAEECEDYCRTYNSCSIKITEKAVYIPEEPKIKAPE